jgi:redox-sensitive bicupin YhaK (pirin superfamily)
MITKNIGQTIGSAMFRGIHAEYSNNEKAEDYEYIFDKLKEEKKLNIGIMDSHPSRYLYFIHGNNTWDERHFMGKRTRIFSRDNKDIWDVDKETEKYLRKILSLYGIGVGHEE